MAQTIGVLVGRVGRPHGLRGELALHATTDSPATIKTNHSHSNSGTVFVNSVVARLVTCETKIMYKLFCAAVFIDIEKK